MGFQNAVFKLKSLCETFKKMQFKCVFNNAEHSVRPTSTENPSEVKSQRIVMFLLIDFLNFFFTKTMNFFLESHIPVKYLPFLFLAEAADVHYASMKKKKAN